MKIRHKLLSDYQYVSNDKKIFLIKSGTIINEYNYSLKNDILPLDREIVDSNPDLFEPIDWKSELLIHLKQNKISPPAQILKKLIPFIEDMILSSINKSPAMNEDEIEKRELRVEKREQSYKDDLKILDKKEDSLRQLSQDIESIKDDYEDKLQDINERERNLDRNILESSKDIDVKYVELQSKIDKDLKEVSEREKDLEGKIKDLKKREGKLSDREAEIDDIVRDITIKSEEVHLLEENLKGMESEIKDWEKKHWKMRRPPPSAIID